MARFLSLAFFGLGAACLAVSVFRSSVPAVIAALSCFAGFFITNVFFLRKNRAE